MLTLLPALVLAAAPAPPVAPVPARDPGLTLQQKAGLRCAAAFAIVQRDRNAGTAAHPGYPDMEVRGKEFFVRTGAQLMDELGIDRGQVQGLILAEVAALDASRGLEDVRPGCLLLLDASGL